MKKTLYIAAIAALFTLSSCQKGEVANKDNYTGEDPVFTATIASDATRTLIDHSAGKVRWKGGEEIEITDASGKTVEYKVSAVSKDSRTATITKKDTETKTLGDGPYKAVYGSSPSTSKSYDSVAPLSDLPMEATSETTNLEFKITCGALEIRLKKAGTTITKIEVSNATATYTLDCNNVSGVSIVDTTSFYIALPVGEYTKFVFTTSDGKTCIKQNNANGVKLLANQIMPITFTNMLFFPADAIHGLFSVDEDGTKVCFAKGNLYYDGYAFKFEDNQYSSTSTRLTNHISHFFWSKSASVAYTAPYSDVSATANDIFFTNATETTPKSDFTVNGATGIWRSLSGNSSSEWNYLLETRTVNGGTGDGKSYKRATIRSDVSDGVYGLIIYPDSYTAQTIATSYTSEEWTAMESAGCVFLPAAGFYGPQGVTIFGKSGAYVSSKASNANTSIQMAFSASGVSVGASVRKYAISVRLVYEIQKAPDVTSTTSIDDMPETNMDINF